MQTRALFSTIFLFAMLAFVESPNALGCTPVALTTSSNSTELVMGDGATQSEVQGIGIYPTDQEFELSFTSDVTGIMSNVATAQQVQDALNSLLDAPTTVSVTSNITPGYIVTFGDLNPHALIRITHIFGICQNITFGEAPTIEKGGTGVVTASTNATPSSDYPITFSTTSADCSVTSNGIVMGINAGSDNCVVTASQAGGPAWDSESATQTLSIQAATPVRLQSFGVD
jgi:hypothetical protein